MHHKTVCFTLLWIAVTALLVLVVVLLVRLSRLEGRMEQDEQPPIHRWIGDD